MPSGLSLYWLTNNIISTAQQTYLRKSLARPTAVPPPAPRDRSDDASTSGADAPARHGEHDMHAAAGLFPPSPPGHPVHTTRPS